MSESCVHRTVSAGDLSDGEEVRAAGGVPPGRSVTHARTHARTLPPRTPGPLRSAQYLRQLQHHRVVHIELGWNRLNEVGATHGDDAEASAEGLQLLDGPDEVVSEARKSCLNTSGGPAPATTRLRLGPRRTP